MFDAKTNAKIKRWPLKVKSVQSRNESFASILKLTKTLYSYNILMSSQIVISHFKQQYLIKWLKIDKRLNNDQSFTR